MVIAAMLGLRLDRSRWQAIATIIGIAVSVVVSYHLTDMRPGNILGTSSHEPLVAQSVAYVAGTWFVLYVGHALVYLLGIHRLMRRKLGPERAYTVYSTGLGIIYFNAIWCQLPFLSALGGTLPLEVTTIQVLLPSLMLFLGAFFIKMWATLYLGLDGYYYRDMFLERRREDGPITDGPYAVFSDPMYSVGYFPIYSGAVFALSVQGLIAAIVFHASIYTFNMIVEKPFVARMYGSALASATVQRSD